MPVILSNNEAVECFKIVFMFGERTAGIALIFVSKILNLITVLHQILKDGMKNGIIVICIAPCNLDLLLHSGKFKVL